MFLQLQINAIKQVAWGRALSSTSILQPTQSINSTFYISAAVSCLEHVHSFCLLPRRYLTPPPLP